jgi:hydroxymethylbilane synthase
LRPDLELADIRGNIDTRLHKLDEGHYDAIVLAAAGLRRLGWEGRIVDLLAPPRMLPAPGQGALAMECRASDAALRKLVGPLDDPPTRQAVEAERSLLAELGAGCSAPVGAWGRIKQRRLVLDGLVADLAGSRVLRASARGETDSGEGLGREVAAELLKQGAAELIAAARNAC